MYRISLITILAFVLPIILTNANWQDTVWCKESNDIHCPADDVACENDKLGYEAIYRLHQQIDDDHNGNLDRSESVDFMRDELQYKDGFERQSNFHGSDDLISISDLWRLWIKSAVYNWTTDDVVSWLTVHVELEQYAHAFKVNSVDGRTLPRIAVMNGQYLGSILGIKSSSHKKKLAFKAMDVVLFGAPKYHNYVKDVALVVSLLVAIAGCWVAYVQHVYSQSHLKKVMKDLATLQASEDSLGQLQSKLEMAEQDQKEVSEQKHHLEEKLKAEITEAKAEAERLRQTRLTTQEEMSRINLADEELVQVRRALRKAERKLEERDSVPEELLQRWLQLSYEMENKHFNVKREEAERQLAAAREMCEKINKKRTAFMGSFRIAHSTSMDDTDMVISSARTALEDMRMDMQERSSRWCQIERICNFDIIINPGLLFLENNLQHLSGYVSHPSSSSLLAGSVGSMSPPTDDDRPPSYPAATALFSSSCPTDSQHSRRSMSRSSSVSAMMNKGQGDPLRQRQVTPTPLLGNSSSLGTLDSGTPDSDASAARPWTPSAPAQNRTLLSRLATLDKLTGSTRVAALGGRAPGAESAVAGAANRGVMVSEVSVTPERSPQTPPPTYNQSVTAPVGYSGNNNQNNRVRFKLTENSAIFEKALTSLPISLSDSSLQSLADRIPSPQSRKIPSRPTILPPSPLTTDDDVPLETMATDELSSDERKKRKKKTLLPKLLKSPISDRGKVC